jgi:RNA polymerase sigma-70 factor (ECF subfamily)
MRYGMGVRAEARIYCPRRDGWWSEGRVFNRCGRPLGIATRKPVDYAELTDEGLVDLVASRDVRALETLYGRHARAVYSLSLRMLREPAAAEEIVQECFLKLWRQPYLYQPGRGKLLSWLLGVTHHRAVDQLRRRKVEQRYSLNGQVEPASTRDDPEQHVWGRLQMEALSQALASLPPSQGITLELAYLAGMTQAEIAAHLGQPLGTIKTRMRLAMQKLRAVPELAALVADEG